MIGTHQLHLANADMIPGVVPDRQQYDRHAPIFSMILIVHLANADMIPGVNISY